MNLAAGVLPNLLVNAIFNGGCPAFPDELSCKPNRSQPEAVQGEAFVLIADGDFGAAAAKIYENGFFFTDVYSA
jgi:hypothetical protein